jgi:transmembrane sensor
MDKRNDHEIGNLLADESFVSWVLTPGDTNEASWTTWLAQNPGKRAVVSRARNILLSLNLKDAMPPLTPEELAELTNRINVEINPVKHSTRIVRLSRSRWIRIAAILLIAITATVLIYRNNRVRPNARQSSAITLITYTNSDIKPKLIKLSDQSLVILQPHSAISYPAAFSGSERRVHLSGEAFFEVRKIPIRPFFVTANHLVTKVLGTSFTVRAFPNTTAKVIVNTGKVQVTKKDSLDKIISVVILLPNEEVAVDKGTAILQKKVLKFPSILSKEIALKVFSFNEAPLATIVEKLQLAYQVSITYDQEKFANSTVTGSLGNLPLDEKIKLICKVINAQYAIEDGIITIK